MSVTRYFKKDGDVDAPRMKKQEDILEKELEISAVVVMTRELEILAQAEIAQGLETSTLTKARYPEMTKVNEAG